METPKQKAESLFNQHKMFSSGIVEKIWIANTKLNALITVNEIIEAFDLYGNDLMGEINYWQEVKQELEKLL